MAPIVTNPYRFAAAAGVTGFDVANATYTGDSFSVASQETIPQGLSFAGAGSYMYLFGSATPDAIYQYDLTTPYDITTASYTASVATHSAATNTTGGYMKEDGTEVYYCDSSANSVFQSTLSTAYDITTATHTAIVTAPDSATLGMFMRENGTELWTCGIGLDRVYRQIMSTPWDITTAGTATNLYIGTWGNSPNGVYVKPDGTKFWVIDDQYNRIVEFDMSTSWDVTTGTWNLYKTGIHDGTPTELTFSANGNWMYEMGINTDTIYKWDCS